MWECIYTDNTFSNLFDGQITNFYKEGIGVKEILNKLYEAVDWEHDFEYDDSKSLEEQNLSEDAKQILAMIYMRFFADEEEKEEFKKII